MIAFAQDDGITIYCLNGEEFKTQQVKEVDLRFILSGVKGNSGTDLFWNRLQLRVIGLVKKIFFINNSRV